MEIRNQNSEDSVEVYDFLFMSIIIFFDFSIFFFSPNN